ncbi:MAG: dienelactone hydrolase [Planctomycetaceae bacterium]|jgi:dienelactone hydrolase
MLGYAKARPAHFGKRKAMQIRVQCPACEASFEVPTALVGRDGECSQCRKVFRVTPLSDEVDPSVLTSGDSNATLEMPVVDDDGPAPDTDEFEVPEIPEAPSEAAQSAAPELEVPELDIPAAPHSDPKIEGSAAELPQLDVDFEVAPEEELPPVLVEEPPILIEEDGSLFGDEIPELEEVRDPVSRYASEDEEDPDAGGSYSLSGDSPAPVKRKAKKARRKKATKKKAAARRSDRPGTAGDDSRATSDPDLDVDEVQLFDDVLHDDDEEDAGPGSSPVLLRRSGTFSTPGKPTGKRGGNADDSAEGPSGVRRKRQPAARTEKAAAVGGKPHKEPVLKRRSSEDGSTVARSEATAAPARRPRKKSQAMSPETQQKLIKMVGGGAVLLVLAGVFSWLTSGPPVTTPTIPGGPGNTASNQPSGSAPVPNQGSDTIQTGDTNSSVARANRTRGAGGPPRRIGDPADGTNDRTDGTTSVAALETGELTGPDGKPLPGSETPAGPLPDGTAVVARPFSTPTGLVVVPADEANGSAVPDPDNFQTEDDKLFPIDSVAIPTFPSLRTSRASTISGVVYHKIAVAGNRRNRDADGNPLPGSEMDMILYLPSGAHKSGSLPCVMIAAAGTTLLEGNGCYDESYQSETIPYVKAGFAVLGYSLDGPLESDEPTGRESRAAYMEFRAAHAGLVNSRNALEFLVQKVPAINRNRIFTAGHSSAGTLALLFAEHESRIAGCVAYAPCLDLEKRLADYISSAVIEVLMPDVEQFVRQESPLRHFKSLKCPVFLFHAEGDEDTPFDESKELTERLAAQGTLCKLESVPDGDHYNSMLEEGIPRGIVWLKNSASKRTAEPVEP